MLENSNDQWGQGSSTGQQKNQNSQQNQDLPRGVKDFSSTNTEKEKDENDCSNQDQNSTSECETGHKTYAGIRESQDSNEKKGSHQDSNSDNSHLENQNFQGEQKSASQEQNQGSQQYQGSQSSEENQSFQGDKSTGQVKFQGQPIQGNQNREGNFSSNTRNDEDDLDVSKQEEITHPERERSTTTPYGGNSTDSKQGYNQNSDLDDDDAPIDESTLLK